MTRILWAFVLATTLILSPSRLTAKEPTLAIKAVMYLGGYLFDKAVLDPLWDKAFSNGRERVLQDRLDIYEANLRKVDQKYADEVARFRKQINERTTPEEVRRIVQKSVADLQKRVSQLEERVDDLDDRVKALEDVVFPGGSRIIESRGKTYLVSADVFDFLKYEERQWRDKSNGPMAQGSLYRVSPDGVVLVNFVGSNKVEKMIKWSKFSSADQHHILAVIKTQGTPKNGVWLNVNEAPK
jgi:hypothetical protein